MRALHGSTARFATPPFRKRWSAGKRYHREFHLTLIAGCRMPLLLGFCRVLLNLNDRYRRTFLQRDLRRPKRQRRTQRDRRKARWRAMRSSPATRLREHIHRTGTNLRAHLADKIAP